MKCRDVDVGAARLEQRAPPLGPDSRQYQLELLALYDPCFDPGGQVRQFVSSDVKVATGTQETAVREGVRRTFQECSRCGRQLRDRGAAIALQPESGRPPGSMDSALAFRLDQQDRPVRGKLGAEARSGYSAADDQDVVMAHFRRWLRF